MYDNTIHEYRMPSDLMTDKSQDETGVYYIELNYI